MKALRAGELSRGLYILYDDSSLKLKIENFKNIVATAVCTAISSYLSQRVNYFQDPVLSTNFLYDLDRLTQEIIEEVLKNPIEFGIRRVTLPELSRLRRQFINYVKQNPIEDTNKIRPLFENYIRNITI